MKRLLDDTQLNRLSEILADIGLVFFATMGIGPFLTGLDKLDPRVVAFGLGTALGFWISSVRLVKKK